MKYDYFYFILKLIEYVCIIFFFFGERIFSNDINKNNVIFFGIYKGDEDEEDKKVLEEELVKDFYVVFVDVKIIENCEKYRIF